MKKRILVVVAAACMLFGGCSAKEVKEDSLSCTVKVSCEALLEDMEKIDEIKREVMPEDGIIIFKEDVPFSEGEAAFDVVKELFEEEGIQLEYEKVPAYDSVYIEGIGNIYEKDAGDMSGWGYTVNGEYISTGLNKYILNDGDKVEFSYIVSFD